MAELRHLIPRHQAKALWALKDQLEVLSADPLRLHKTAFLEYLRAKGEQLYAEAAHESDDLEQKIACQKADAYLRQLTAEWKKEAKKHALATA